MKTRFKEIQDINKKFYSVKKGENPSDIVVLKAMAKLGEEYGELIRGLNMIVGVKISKDSKVKILANVKEESADVLQNIFSICDMLDISFESLIKELSVKNKKWKSKKIMKQKTLNKS